MLQARRGASHVTGIELLRLLLSPLLVEHGDGVPESGELTPVPGTEGPEGGAKLAEALKTNTTLTHLKCALAALEPMPSARSCGRAPG